MFTLFLLAALSSSHLIVNPADAPQRSQGVSLIPQALTNGKQVYGLETSNNQVFATFYTGQGVRHQNLLDPNNYYVDQESKSGRGVLFVNSTFGYSADSYSNSIVSVTFDEQKKSAVSKRICEFAHYLKFTDIALSRNGELYFSATQLGKGGYGEGAKGFIYKCTPHGLEEVIADYSQQILGLVANDDSLTILGAVVEGNDTKNSTLSEVNLKSKDVTHLAVKEFNAPTTKYDLVRAGNHYYALWGFSKIVYKLDLSGRILETYETNITAHQIASYTKDGNDILLVYGYTRSPLTFKIEEIKIL